MIILVLKDAPIAEALIRDLGVLGYPAEACEDPKAIGAKLRANPPAALIVEDRAARMNPVKVVQEIRRAAGRAVPAVVINNLQLASAVLDSMRAELGLGEVLTKPFSLDTLSKTLRNLGVPRGNAPAADELQSVTDYNSPQEVFYALLGKAVRTDGHTMIARERSDGATYAYLRKRTLIAVSTRDPNEAGLARVLVREGVIRADELPKNVSGPPGMTADRKLEELLLAQKTIDKEALSAAISRLAQERFQRLFGWRTGTTQLRNGEQPQNASAVQLDVVPLILAGLGAHGDGAVMARVLNRARPARLAIDKEIAAPLRRFAANRYESSFLDLLCAHPVGRALKLSGITEEAAAVWLTYLRFIEDVAPREAQGGGADPTSFALRLRKVEHGKERDAADAKTKEADREHAIGWKMVASGHFEDAAARFKRVIELDPSRAIAHVNLGWCLFRMLPDPRKGGVSAASERILEGLSRDPRLGVGYLYLGRIHAALGEVDHAARQYLKAIEVDPGNTEALEELRQIHLGRPSVQVTPNAPSPQPEAFAPGGLALVVADWGRGTAPALASAAKARLLAEVRDAGGSLEEFSFTRLSAVLDAGDESRSSRLIAARLAVRLRDALQEIERAAGIGLAPRVAVVQAGSKLGDAAVEISDALNRARPLLQLADTWQVVAEASMYRGLESLIDERRIPTHPDAVEVRASAQVIEALVASSSAPAPARTPWGTSLAPISMYPAPLPPIAQQVAPVQPFTPYGSYPPPAYAPPPYGSWGGYPMTPAYPMQGMGTPPMGMALPQLAQTPPGMISQHSLPPGALHSGYQVQTVPPQVRHSMPPMPAGAEHSAFGTKSLQRSRLEPGTVLGNYRVEHLVGTGGMGEVYRATDLALLRPVALKLMRRELLNSPMALRRFQHEAQALARINCANVVQIYGVSMDTDPAWLVMEFVDGSSLRELLKDRGALPVRDVVEMGLQTVNGLEKVFENGLIHRDVNPKNLLITATGVVKITDFGMVKMDLAGPMGSVTHNVVGTPLYLAPEQAQGAPVDHRTDLYGLGVTLFHLCAGRPPFIGRTMAELLTKQILEPLPPLATFCPEAPPELVALIERLAAKDPAGRPSTHREVAATLEAILRQLGEG